jgi:hypothetical protein
MTLYSFRALVVDHFDDPIFTVVISFLESQQALLAGLRFVSQLVNISRFMGKDRFLHL